MAKLLEGKQVVACMAKDLGARVEALRGVGVAPTLGIVRMGAQPDDLSYERTAKRRAEGLGIDVRVVELDERASQEELECALRAVNDDGSVHGCLLFRPLPDHVDEREACNVLAGAKDIDGITRTSLATVFIGEGEGFPPCTAEACVEMIDAYGIPIEGKRVAVVGRSLVIGKPVAMMLLARHASVTLCHSRSENLASITKEADIVICATGRARAFGAEFFAPGQTVLDVGINFDDEGTLCGDVDFAAVEPIVGAITPVPGGLGSVTTSVAMRHTVAAAEAALAARA